MASNYRALTVKSNGNLLSAIKTEATITIDGKKFSGFAIWDTGASKTCISERIVNTLALSPIGYTVVSTANGFKDARQFLVDLILPNKVIFSDLRVTEFSGTNDVDFLIGMDVICLGDFSITNANSKTFFSFRIPSDWCHIDYVEVAKSSKHGKNIKNQLKKFQV